MNREALDEFFAKADDVLTDWSPSNDAMVARVDDEGAELPVADSYYAQQMPWANVTARPPRTGSIGIPVRTPLPTPEDVERAMIAMRSFGVIWSQAATTMAEQMVEIGQTITAAIGRDRERLRRRALGGSVPTFTIIDEPHRLNETARDRALRLRRSRNTGPSDRLGLDGHLRRRTAR